MGRNDDLDLLHLHPPQGPMADTRRPQQTMQKTSRVVSQHEKPEARRIGDGPIARPPRLADLVLLSLERTFRSPAPIPRIHHPAPRMAAGEAVPFDNALDVIVVDDNQTWIDNPLACWPCSCRDCSFSYN